MPNMPPPAERRKSSKQLLEEKQIKRYLRAKKRSRSRGAKQKIPGDDTENGRELKDSPCSKGGLESQENAMEKIPGDDTENGRVLEDSPCSKEELESQENAMKKIPGGNTENGRELGDFPCPKEQVESTENALEENLIRSDESRDGKRWMEYKITKVVSIERNITYVKVPKQLLAAQ